MKWKSPKAEIIPVIEDLIKQDLRPSRIAQHFDGASRNAVIGFCKRHKITLAHSNPNKGSTAKKPRRRPVNTLGTFKTAGAQRAAPRAPDPVEPTGPGVPFMEAGSGHCRAPQWDVWPGSDKATYCGAPVVEGQSWCAFHAKKFTNPLALRAS